MIARQDSIAIEHFSLMKIASAPRSPMKLCKGFCTIIHAFLIPNLKLCCFSMSTSNLLESSIEKVLTLQGDCCSFVPLRILETGLGKNHLEECIAL